LGLLAGFGLAIIIIKGKLTMDRRHFFQQASVAGVAATLGCYPSPSATDSPSRVPESVVPAPEHTPGVQSEEGVRIRPSTGDVMREFPPAPDKQVTRWNYEESQDKLRWAMQHWRELFPTQRVHRGNHPIGVLPRRHRDDILQLEFTDATGASIQLGTQLERLDIDAFIVLKEGRILCEEYFHGMRPETPHAVYSINKSIVATVIATLLGDEQLEETRTIESYIPELRGTAYEGATLRQCLDMESGIRYTYGVDNSDTIAQHERAISPSAREQGVPIGDYHFLATLGKTQLHGEGMIYKESDPGVLVWAAEKVTGQRFATLLSERVWSRLGAEFDLDATCDQLGHWTYHLALTLRDLARWGQMCLNDGRFHDQQVVPRSFFEDIRHNARVERLSNAPMVNEFFPPGIGYRSFFYHHQDSGDSIAAAGGYGQFCYANRRHNTVITFFSTTNPWSGQAAAGIPFEEIFELDKQQERERWQLCHELSQVLSHQ
jgi:CubicO group peptidase (beta-lactamase class C family)